MAGSAPAHRSTDASGVVLRGDPGRCESPAHIGMGGSGPALRGDGGETLTHSGIDWFNDSGTSIIVFWLNYSGHRVFYETLSDREGFVHHTWLTHPWILVDSAGRRRGFTISDRVKKSYTIR